MDALTTGDMLYLDNGGSSITGDGKFINCNNDDTSVFSVASGGLTTIAGDSSGTDALIITNGDILVSSGNIDMTVGDLTLADGSISVTDADNASSLTITNNTITDTDALVDIRSSSITRIEKVLESLCILELASFSLTFFTYTRMDTHILVYIYSCLYPITKKHPYYR